MELKLLSKYLYVVIAFILILLFFYLFAREKQKKESIKSFRIFYDNVNNEILGYMKDYDLNIVEASFFDKNQVNFLHNNGSKVIGYISLVEVGYWDLDILKNLKEEDYLLVNNKKVQLENKNYLASLASENFQNILMDIIEKRILSKNMDGIFLDTLDWIDYYKDNTQVSTSLLKGYQEFLQKIRKKYPKLLIVQNRGFLSFESFSKHYINGFLWENFNTSIKFVHKEKKREFEKFLRNVHNNHILFLAISFMNEDENRKSVEQAKGVFQFSDLENRYSSWNIVYK